MEWPGSAYERMLREAEGELVHESMSLAQGNMALAARLLGIARPTLRSKLAKHGIGSVVPGKGAPPVAPPAA